MSADQEQCSARDRIVEVLPLALAVFFLAFLRSYSSVSKQLPLSRALMILLLFPGLLILENC